MGLAVGDIKAIQDEAELRSNLLQVCWYVCISIMCIYHLSVCVFAFVLCCNVLELIV